MAELYTHAWDGDAKIPGSIWADAPDPGTKWFMPAGGRQPILIKKATARQPHPGEWTVRR